MATDCAEVFKNTYDAFVSAGRTTAEALAAAQSAMSACLTQSATAIVVPQVAVAGGRLKDTGPIQGSRTPIKGQD